MRTHSRRFWLTAVLIVAVGIAALAINPIGSSAENSSWTLPPSCHNNPVTAPEFQTFSESVWSRDHWRRAVVKEATLDAKAHKLHCAAGPGHVASMESAWSKDHARFDKFRHDAMWRSKYRQFVYPDGSHWAVPYPIATCESGDPGEGIYGNYYAGPDGAYGLTPGGGFREYMAPKEQDEAAFHQFEVSGEGAWLPYESGCAER